jgi:uncharacterized integral membrane protein
MGFYLVAIAAIVLGLLVGTLNSGLIQLDLLWIQLDLPLGLALLLGFSMGLIMGLGLLYFARVLPLRFQLRKARANSIRKENPRENAQDSLGVQDKPDLILPDD